MDVDTFLNSTDSSSEESLSLKLEAPSVQPEPYSKQAEITKDDSADEEWSSESESEIEEAPKKKKRRRAKVSSDEDEEEWSSSEGEKEGQVGEKRKASSLLEQSEKKKTKLGKPLILKIPVPGERKESSEEEDDYGTQLTLGLDRAIHETIRKIRTKAPEIYDTSKVLVPDVGEMPAKKAKPKPNEKMDIGSLLVKQILERDGNLEEDLVKKPTPKQVVDRAKNAFITAAEGSDKDNDEELFTLSKEPSKINETVENEFSEWIKKHPAENEAKFVDEFWVKQEHDDKDDNFLKQYMEKQLWKMNDEDVDGNPGGLSPERLKTEPDGYDSDELLEDIPQFHHQEENFQVIQSFPRNVEGSLRKKDTRRKEARERRKIRKDKEKRDLMTKITKVQEEKTAEIEESLDLLFEETGLEKLPFSIEELAGDFDPSKMDKFVQLVADQEINKKKEAENNNKAQQRGVPKVYKESLKNALEKIKKSVDERNQPLPEEEDHKIYRYKRVAPNTFGLTIEQILSMDDSELNKIASVKYCSPFRQTPLRFKRYENKPVEYGGKIDNRKAKWKRQQKKKKKKKKKKADNE